MRASHGPNCTRPYGTIDCPRMRFRCSQSLTTHGSHRPPKSICSPVLSLMAGTHRADSAPVRVSSWITSASRAFSPPRTRRFSRSPPRRVSTPSGIRRYPEHASGKRVRNLRSARPYRCAHDPLARSLADHPHTATPSLTVAAAKAPNPAIMTFRDAPLFDITGEERFLQDIMDEVLAQGVWIARARRLRGQQLVESWPSIRLAVTAALSRKECERAAVVVKATVTKVLTKRK
jgi:hypothetical protein